MVVDREGILPCGEACTLEAATAFCGKSRCLTHMGAVCSTPASFPFFLTFAPAHLPQPSSLNLSPLRFLPALATIQVHSLMPASPFLPPYLETLKCLSHFFTSISLPTTFPSLSTSSCTPPPQTSMCTSYTQPCRWFFPCLPPPLHPALPACLSNGKPRFLSLLLPDLI